MIRILRAGACSTIQDLGRTGWRAHGIPVAGAMDGFAARVANLILGNSDDTAVIEMTLAGMCFRVEKSNWFAFCGADFNATLNASPLPSGRPVWVEAGSVLDFPAAAAQCRGYLAVRGGFAADEIFGSFSTDLRAGFGGYCGRLLQRDDEVCYRAAVMPTKPREVTWFTSLATAMNRLDLPLRLLSGPALERLSAQARGCLLEDRFTVTRDSDRMGMRLAESLPGAAQLPSQISHPVVFGSLQLPADGRPIILGADCQTTGGYPVIGIVATVDHGLVAQARPGDTVRFRQVTVIEAQQAWCWREQQLRRFALAVNNWWKEGN